MTETRACQSCKKDFVIEQEDFNFYKKISVPPPTWCPQCRMIRRFMWRNEHKLFRRKEDRQGKEVFSMYHKDSPVKIWERDYWWSDAWDPLKYGREYDFSRPFFEQMRELMLEAPIASRAAQQLVNSDYVSNVTGAKNAYLCFFGSNIEDSAYVIDFKHVTNGFDLYQSRHTEFAYDCYMVDESNRVFFSTNCEDCHDIWFSKNMLGCQNCFGCMNLRNKSYYIFNKPVGKEAYQKFMKEFKSGSYRAVEQMRAQATELWAKYPNRFTLAINVVNSSGEHIEHTKNVHQSYFVHESQDLKYCQMLENATDSYDYTAAGRNATRIYESVLATIDVDNIRFGWYCFNPSSNEEYCMQCVSSKNNFACVGLNKNEYCIFNKQYTKEQYVKLRAKIIEHMNAMPYIDPQGREYRYGEFFPPEFSPFAYNETIAQDFFPLTKEEAVKKGYLWREEEAREFALTLKSADLADAIGDVPDSITKEVIGCGQCGKAYRIIASEFDFLRRMNLPLPRLCPTCRYNRRFKLVNPPILWPGACQCAGARSDNGVYANDSKHSHGSEHCPNIFETSFAPGRPEIVYCEKCYQAESA